MPGEHVVYPDGAVSCDDRDHENTGFLAHPKVIIEVLSPSTSRYDRTDKFDLYKRLPGLEDYVLLSQNEPKIEIFPKVRDLPAAWLLTTYGPGDQLEIPSLGFTCALNDSYSN